MSISLIKKQTIYTALLILFLSLGCILLSVQNVKAATEVASGTCGDNLTWVLDDEGVLTISGSGTVISGFAFKENTDIKSVTMPNGVTTIGESAFSGCNNLTSITIPDSVTSIGYCAFYNCSKLNKVFISDLQSYLSIQYDNSNNMPYSHPTGAGFGASLYINGELATEIEIPEGVTSIETFVFYKCTSLTSVTLPDSVTSIGEFAFDQCSSLTSINIPNSVTRIDRCAFRDCSSLTSINIPNSVTTIQMCAFQNCSNLENVTISDNVTIINSFLFAGCRNLTRISIPDGVTSINNNAFDTCSSLERITIPEGVTSICGYAFSDCCNLKRVMIPDSVTSIVYNPFNNCINLCCFVRKGSYAEQYVLAQGINYKYSCIGDHTWAEEYTIDKVPTCTEEGSESIHCSVCDAIEEGSSRKIDKKGHQWNAGYTVDLEPTCKEEGSESIHCSVCDAIKEDSSRAIAKKGHAYGNLVTKKDATCTEDGMNAYYKCSVCEKYFDSNKNETTAEALRIAKKEHTYGSFVAKKDATCTEDGMNAYYKCSVCEKYFDSNKNETTVEALKIPAKGHTYGSLVPKKDATCTEDGMNAYYKCSVCEKYFDSSKKETTAEALKIPAKGHSFSEEFTVDVEPTCTTEGSKSKHCANCGEKSEVTSINALGQVHFGTYPQTEIVSKPSDSGVYGKTWAKESDYEINEELYNKLKLANYNETGDTIIDGAKYRRARVKYSNDSNADVRSQQYNNDSRYHYFRYDPIKWIVLSAEGTDMLLVSSICLDHCLWSEGQIKYSWETSNVRNWLNSGFYDAAFNNCEKSLVANTSISSLLSNDTLDNVFLLSYEDVLNPLYGFSQEADAQDENRQLKSSTYAKAMGVMTESRTDKTYRAYLGNCANDWLLRDVWKGSRYPYSATYSVSGFGSVGAKFQLNTSNASAIRPAVRINISSEGVDWQNNKVMVNHDWNNEFTVDVEPTCTTEGSKSKHCANCGEKKDTTIIPAKGHSFSEEFTVDVEPTCITEGSKSKHCEGCEEKLEATSIDALGHDLSHHNAKSPTCTEDGWDDYDTCSRCDYTTYQKNNKLGHDLIHHNAKSPTCTEDGWVSYDTCSRCDYTTYQKVNKLGHDLTHHNAKSPTCTEDGWEAYDTCSRCDYSTYQKVNKLGHDLIHHDAKASTCIEDGWEAYDTCSRCDYTTYQKVNKLGHDLTHHNAKSPTCTEDGWDDYDTCSRCDYSTYQTINKLGHDWTSWQIINNPTCSTVGKRARFCNRCDAEESRPIDITGHNFTVWKTTKKATELAAGQKTRTCTVCGIAEKQAIAQLKPSLPAVTIINPTSKAKKSAMFKWKKVSKANQKKIASIQIQYSLDKKFKKGVKTTTAKKAATSKKISKLTSKKVYYVRVRSYKKDKKGVHISKWSAVRAVRVK